jgi:hypothetical protein
MNLTKLRFLSVVAKYLWTQIANTLMVISLLSLLSYAILNARDKVFIESYYEGLDNFQKSAYSDMEPDHINDLLAYTWDLKLGGWEYEEMTGFREKARTSRFVNVNPLGFRSNGVYANEADVNFNNKIWVLGGSTTFGYGVRDSDTIPAYLEKISQLSTINFGRGYYYSKQENLLLERLLSFGYQPRAVIFLDGINERCGIEVYQKEMHDLFSKAQHPEKWSPLATVKSISTPILELLVRVNKKFKIFSSADDKAKASSNEKLHKTTCNAYGAKTSLSSVLNANLSERSRICSQYNLRCTTFVQPFAGVHAATNSKIKQEDIDDLNDKFEILKPVWLSHNAIFITDVLKEKSKHSFVDGVHYSTDANAAIAKSIVNNLDLR